MRPLTAQSGKGLTACLAESEQPGTEINLPQSDKAKQNGSTHSTYPQFLEFYSKSTPKSFEIQHFTQKIYQFS
ncbi:hypothetical protein IHV12_05050 [Fictibacillus sp. 7GRE50]|uniref:hypothetical protein n=1 Tax=Fictibacillus sp. 7GRE50 TaxID=2745878 RepID=UPI0018CD9913|nr:hypothetical protein [Fictibacillus sp. 7GRE50]MBH0164271.1 hypothetical protein [Fictibacillus sp. 7GRE50]